MHSEWLEIIASLCHSIRNKHNIKRALCSNVYFFSRFASATDSLLRLSEVAYNQNQSDLSGQSQRTETVKSMNRNSSSSDDLSWVLRALLIV